MAALVLAQWALVPLAPVAAVLLVALALTPFQGARR